MLRLGIALLIWTTALMKCGNPPMRARRAAIPVDVIPWPEGVIPYIIDKSTFSGEELELLEIAIETWNSETCVRFRPYNRDDKQWLRITDGDSCFSEYLGFRGRPGEQRVSLSRYGCRYYGLYLHELGHVIGLDHEHIRADRNTYIDVNVNGVPDKYKSFFTRKSPKELNTYDSPYDLQSIMQYGQSSLSVLAGNDPIRVKDEKQRHILRDVYVKDISFWDTRILNLHYSCKDKCSTALPNCSFPGYIDKFCKCHTPSDFSQRRCVDTLETTECVKLTEKLECYRNASFMTARCRKTCGFCYQDVVSNIKEPLNQCKDRQENCANLANAGHCSATSAFMKMMCPWSCNFCNQTDNGKQPDIGEVDRCRDLYLYPSDCESWAKEDKCHNNMLWMSYNCAKSCGFCPHSSMGSSEDVNTPLPSTSEKETPIEQSNSCVDNYGGRNCEPLASRKLCSTHKSWMARQCSATCGFCQSKAFTTSRIKPQISKASKAEASKGEGRLSAICQNADPPGECPRYYSYCNSIHLFQRCPNICKNCGQCGDKSKDCKVLKRNGYCERYPGSTIPICRKTCGVCFE